MSDFSSIRAWASAAVKSPISWPWAWRFCRAGLVGLTLGEAVGVADGVGEGLAEFAAGLALADGDGDAEAAGNPAVSASAPAGASSRPSPPASPRAAIVTLRRVRTRAATAGREFTAL